MKKLLFLMAASIILMGCQPLETVRIGNTVLRVRVADTEERRETGLSDRFRMPRNEGMLFVHETPGMHHYWMKDMRFPIDIVWIDQNRKVVGVIPNVEPNSFPEKFSPPEPILFVLELNAGQAVTFGIATGSVVQL